MVNLKSFLITTLSGRYIRALNDALRATVGRGGLRIVNFHRVLENNIDINDYRFLGESPTVDEFDGMLNYLSSHYNTISIKDYLKNIDSLDSGKLYVAITFDDGYMDNYTNALPILKKYNAPVTIFVSTNALDKKLLWFQEIYCAINACNIDRVLNPCTNEIVSLKNKWQAMRGICKSIIKVPVEDYKMYIQELYRNCEVSDSQRICESEQMMSWDELKVLKEEHLVDVGSHTINHYPLIGLSDTAIEYELKESYEKLKVVVGENDIHVAYPNGAFNNKVMSIAKEVGYSAAFTMDRGMNNKSTDLFQMRREYVSKNPRRIGFQLDNWDIRIKKALRLSD